MFFSRNQRFRSKTLQNRYTVQPKNTVPSTNFATLIDTSKKLLLQKKNTPKKIYSLHELGVQCIGKGKDRIRYEFGNKAAVVITNNRNWIVNAEDLPENPYDGHTLDRSISGTEKITKVSVDEANVDKGYRGHDYKGAATIRLAGSSNSGLSFSERKQKRRRSAIEPVIGHLKSDHRLDRGGFFPMRRRHGIFFTAFGDRRKNYFAKPAGFSRHHREF